MAGNTGETIPEICGNWANAKGTYRFLSNPNVSDHEILSGHFKNTSDRMKKSDSTLLVLHDTSEFSFKRSNPDEFGFTRTNPSYSEVQQRIKADYRVCGLLMHASLAITPEGLPLGLTSVKYWTRTEFKDTTKMYKRNCCFCCRKKTS